MTGRTMEKTSRVPNFAAAAALAAAAFAVSPPIAAQTPPAGAQAAAIRPLAQPVNLTLQPVLAFRFAGESVNAGAPARNGPNRILAEGSGRVSPGRTRALWQLTFERFTLDGGLLAAVGPLAALTVHMDNATRSVASFDADYSGLGRSPLTASNPAYQEIVRRVVDATAYSLYLPPPGGIGQNTPVVDPNPAIQRHLFGIAQGAQIAYPAAPGLAVGIVGYQGRECLIVRQSGPLVVRAFGQDIQLRSEGDGVIDLLTAMPLFLSSRITGGAPLPIVTGPFDYTVRLAVAFDNMPDPMQTLAAAARPAPPPPAAAAPMPVPAVAAPPRATPAPAPVPPAAASPPAGVSPATQQRLQTLKSLYDQGLITREQFEQRQRELLANP
jgi:hypothetical protein